MVKMNSIKVMILVFYCSSLYALHPEDTKKIGTLIWKNEASGRKDKLVYWSEYESFPSLGVGHCIWYPIGKKSQYSQKFPLLCSYLKKHNVQLPAWLDKGKHVAAPWKDRDSFLKDQKRTDELRTLLASTINLQVSFMVEQLDEKRVAIIRSVSKEQKNDIFRKFTLMQSTPLGLYALIDYLNFKGDGLNPLEENKGQRWGLLQVFLDMPKDITKDNVLQAFTASAAHMLSKLARNSGPNYTAIKFLNGWMARVGTYSKDGLFPNRHPLEKSPLKPVSTA